MFNFTIQYYIIGLRYKLCFICETYECGKFVKYNLCVLLIYTNNINIIYDTYITHSDLLLYIYNLHLYIQILHNYFLSISNKWVNTEIYIYKSL